MNLLSLASRGLGVVLFLIGSSAAYAAAIPVNSTTDALAPVVDANCTLREAILSANTDASVGGCAAGVGADTITFTVTGTITVISTNALPDIITPLTIDGPGGGNITPTVRIDGVNLSTAGGDDEWGFHLAPGSAGSTIRDVMITRFRDGGVWIESANNAIRGNWIGTDGATAGLGNGSGTFGGAIRIQVPFVPTETVSGNTIGGTTPADRNLIEGNSGTAVSVNDFDLSDGLTVLATTIQGNFFNTNPAGTAAGPSGGGAFSVVGTFQAGGLTIGGTTSTTPGGSCTGACNLIAKGANPLINLNGASDGTFVTGISVLGNFIGTDVTGNNSLGCFAATSCAGMQLQFGASGTIGGSTPAARNVIAGLPGVDGVGIIISNTNQNFVPGNTFAPWNIEGNYIGVGSAGAVLANGSHGISTNPGDGLVIGGATAASRNVISGNGGDGIRLNGGNDLVNNGNAIRNNYIGVLPDGTTAAGNGGHGVNQNTGSSGNPDFNLVQDNIIANNTGAGVAITSSGQNNRVLSTSIYNNGGLGIDHDQDATVETNDACDPDSSVANDNQNYPVITTAGLSGGNLTVTGTFNSLASTSFTLEFFGNAPAGDEGRTFLGSMTVTTDGSCVTPFTFGPIATSLVAGNTVTATATNNVVANSDTSEFSAAVPATIVLATPTVAKSFTPVSIAAGGTSTLTIQITNPNATPLTGVAFTDTYPAQITTAGTPNITGTCGGGTVGSTSGTFTLTGGSIAGSGSCTLTIDVTSSSVGGPYTNNVTVTSNAADGLGSAGLTVTALVAPTITKTFAPTSIAAGGTSTLSIQISNPNASPLTGVAFTDTYPVQITTAVVPNITGNCGGGTTGSASGTFTLAGGSIAASGSCTLTIDVTSSTPGGPYTNNVTVTGNAPDGTDSADLTVSALTAPTVTKSFAPATIASGGVSTLSIQITNTNGSAISNVAFTDTYPLQITTAAVPNITGNCNGGTTGSTSGTFTLTGGSLAGSASCTVTIDVTSATAGSHLNNVTVTSTAADGSGSATLTVLAPPTVTKSFAPDTLGANAPSTLTISLGNTNATSITGVNLTDSFPAGLVVAMPNALVNGCGGTATATVGSGLVTLTGGTIPNGGCTITVNVTSASAAAYTNTIATTDVTTSNAGSPTAPASDTVTFTATLTATKSFAPANIAPGAASTLTITITNPNPVAATGVGYTDSYPAAIANSAMPNGATTCGGGTITAVAAASSHQAAGLTVPASSSCTVTVQVTSSTAGAHANTIPAGGITSSNTGATTAATTAVLTVNSPPTITKAFAPATIPVNGTSTLTVTLTNPNAVALSGAAFTDSYPAGLVNGTPANGATTCGGSVTAAAGGNSLALTGGTIPANGSCTVTVTVTATAVGPYQNTTSPLTTSNSGPSAAAGTATFTVTGIVIPVTATRIPALSSLMLLLLAAMLAGVAAFAVRR